MVIVGPQVHAWYWLSQPECGKCKGPRVVPKHRALLLMAAAVSLCSTGASHCLLAIALCISVFPWVPYSVHLVHCNFSTSSRHHVAQKLHLRQEQSTLFLFHMPVLGSQTLKHRFDMGNMLLSGLGINQNIIHIDQDTLVQQICGQQIH